MSELSVGDKVRVTLEGKVTYVYNDKLTVDVDAGLEDELETIPVSQVEVLAKVSAVSQDPIGTVRQGYRGPWAKTHENTWVLLSEDEQDTLSDARFAPNRHPIIGAVPGSPAAQALEGNEATPQFQVGQRIKGDHNGNLHEGVIVEVGLHCQLCEDNGLDASGQLYRLDNGYRVSYESAKLVEPLVVHKGDPEPDRSKKFKDREGDTVRYSQSAQAWTYLTEGTEPLELGEGYGSWDLVVEDYGPLTEIQS